LFVFSFLAGGGWRGGGGGGGVVRWSVVVARREGGAYGLLLLLLRAAASKRAQRTALRRCSHAPFGGPAPAHRHPALLSRAAYSVEAAVICAHRTSAEIAVTPFSRLG
jgi:hypothetical protein